MPFKIVRSLVKWIAEVSYLDGSCTVIQRRDIIGEFEDKIDAEYALAEAGLTRKSWGWEGPYCTGSVVRMLDELPD